ncbi:MAG: DUF320 domain-containing protein, partial [Streptosporangiales bacterium]|nr:DUF320 domain-containing protein [Streptosporangiales bacterium]
SAGGGNQVYAPVSLPVNICGNALAVAGQAAAMCEGGASVHNGSDGDAARRMAAGDGLTTSGDGSFLGGNQIVAPISAPINVCGNALAVLGQAAGMCKGGAHVNPPAEKPGYGERPDVRDPQGSGESGLPGLDDMVSVERQESGPTAPAEDMTPAPGAVGGLRPVAQSLPMTGFGAISLMALAAGSVLAGAASMVVSRRRGVGRS